MPTWGEILRELGATLTPQGTPDFDAVRRKYLWQLHEYTGRAVILYASSFLESKPAAAADLQINTLDIQGFMEAVSNIQERQLDLIIHNSRRYYNARKNRVSSSNHSRSRYKPLFKKLRFHITS